MPPSSSWSHTYWFLQQIRLTDDKPRAALLSDIMCICSAGLQEPLQQPAMPMTNSLPAGLKVAILISGVVPSVGLGVCRIQEELSVGSSVPWRNIVNSQYETVKGRESSRAVQVLPARQGSHTYRDRHFVGAVTWLPVYKRTVVFFPDDTFPTERGLLHGSPSVSPLSSLPW